MRIISALTVKICGQKNRPQLFSKKSYDIELQFSKKGAWIHQIHTPNLHIVIILSESFQQCFPDSSFQTDTLVSHTQSQPKSES